LRAAQVVCQLGQRLHAQSRTRQRLLHLVSQLRAQGLTQHMLPHRRQLVNGLVSLGTRAAATGMYIRSELPAGTPCLTMSRA
jgi:hypothetical protein